MSELYAIYREKLYYSGFLYHQVTHDSRGERSSSASSGKSGSWTRSYGEVRGGYLTLWPTAGIDEATGNKGVLARSIERIKAAGGPGTWKIQLRTVKVELVDRLLDPRTVKNQNNNNNNNDVDDEEENTVTANLIILHFVEGLSRHWLICSEYPVNDNSRPAVQMKPTRKEWNSAIIRTINEGILLDHHYTASVMLSSTRFFNPASKSCESSALEFKWPSFRIWFQGFPEIRAKTGCNSEAPSKRCLYLYSCERRKTLIARIGNLTAVIAGHVNSEDGQYYWMIEGRGVWKQNDRYIAPMTERIVFKAASEDERFAWIMRIRNAFELTTPASILSTVCQGETASNANEAKNTMSTGLPSPITSLKSIKEERGEEESDGFASTDDETENTKNVNNSAAPTLPLQPIKLENPAFLQSKKPTNNTANANANATMLVYEEPSLSAALVDRKRSVMMTRKLSTVGGRAVNVQCTTGDLIRSASRTPVNLPLNSPNQQQQQQPQHHQQRAQFNANARPLTHLPVMAIPAYQVFSSILGSILESRPWSQLPCPLLYAEYRAACHRAGYPEECLEAGQVVRMMRHIGYTLKSSEGGFGRSVITAEDVEIGLKQNLHRTGEWYWFHVALK